MLLTILDIIYSRNFILGWYFLFIFTIKSYSINQYLDNSFKGVIAVFVSHLLNFFIFFIPLLNSFLDLNGGLIKLPHPIGYYYLIAIISFTLITLFDVIILLLFYYRANKFKEIIKTSILMNFFSYLFLFISWLGPCRYGGFC